MVYGPNMKSNISRLLALVNSSMPFFYFKATNNYKKSLLSIENIKRIISYNIKTPPSINNQILNIADSEPLSLNEIIFEYKKICLSKSIILPLPNFLFKACFKGALFLDFSVEQFINNNVKKSTKNDCLILIN